MPSPPEARAAGVGPLVVVDGLVKHFVDGRLSLRRAPPVRAVDGVSLRIAAGETLGLVGESGCGKSTLARALLRLVEPTAGRVVIDGTTVTELGARELRRFRRRAQLVFQDALGALDPRLTVGAALAEPLRIHRLAAPGVEERREVERLLERVHLRPELAARLPHELSGGQRQRVGIARALAVRPRFLVADEPVSALDASIQAQIVRLLVEVRAAEGLTCLVIAHDLDLVRTLCDRVAVMYLGRVVEEAPAATLYRSPRHPYTRSLLAAAPSGDPAVRRARVRLDGEAPSPAAPPPGCHFHPRCPLARRLGMPRACVERAPPLAPVAGQPETLAACHFATEAAAHDDEADHPR